jgi:hypothetical protein
LSKSQTLRQNSGKITAGSDAYPAPPNGYDLIAFFDRLHDMGDPVGRIYAGG